MLNTTTISKKGQVVIPKPIRDALKIKASDSFTVKTKGKRIVIEQMSPIDEVYGMFKTKKVINKKDIKDAYKNAISKKYTVK